MEVTIELDAKIAADCSVETDDLWVYANDYVENFDYDSGAINKDWTHLTLKINAKNFEPESEDDSYYFSIFVDGGADIVIKNIVIKGNKPEVSGVSSIAAENEGNSAIYYNLQGQKIAQPAKGSVMIKVEGEKATKIVF